MDKLVIRGARVNNLKNIDIEIPKNKLVVITGLSGSGKSSLAFDTIFAEGQRRYVESLSSYARQFLELQDKPDVDEIQGLAPTIALDQRGISENPRSTVGTITEIADYLRLLFARAGRPKCVHCNIELSRFSTEDIVRALKAEISKRPLRIFAPIVRTSLYRHPEQSEEPALSLSKGSRPNGRTYMRDSSASPQNDISSDLIQRIARAGFEEVRLNGERLPVRALQQIGLPVGPFRLEVVIGVFGPKEVQENSEHLRLQILTALELGDGTVLAETAEENPHQFSYSKDLTCPKCGLTSPALEPRNFSFNSPHGACPACDGLGVKSQVMPELVLPNPRLTLAEGAIKPWARIGANQSARLELLQAVALAHKFDLDTPVGDLPKKAREIIFFGTGDQEYEVKGIKQKFPGVIPELEERYRETDSDYLRKEIEAYMQQMICGECHGARLRPEALAVTFAGKNVAEISGMAVDKAIEFFAFRISERLKADHAGEGERIIATPILKEAITRLKHLQKAGLGYISLDRSSTTLSGGEGQRVRLAVQLATTLSGVIYVLDEPTIGLHERDTEMLLKVLQELCDLQNTVIVVEHDPRIMHEADWLIDMGPGAGTEGGKVVAKGTPKTVIQNKLSLTGAYLSGRKKIVAPQKIRTGNGKAIVIKGASAFNLKNFDVKIPLGKFVCITGVSGSGKSTLILEILAKALAQKLYGAHAYPGVHKEIKGLDLLDKVITVDQAPIGRTPRSNPATYTGIFTIIRDLYTEVPEAKLKGFDAGTFSFNVRGGRCEVCTGEGYIQIPMQFLPETLMVCPECHGRRYRAEALEIHYKDKNIADVLDMSVLEAKEFFKDVSLLFDKLQVLEDVGLGYIKLGQGAPTLSGGEAQRVKLSTELSRRATGKTLYILDEPTTGLHFEDTNNLLRVLQRLVDKGNTVLVIEHNLEVVKSADWVIDMGPEGGDQGGYVVAEGTPRDICKVKKSYTGQYLMKVLRS
ncbi:MAG: UvrABC system protein A [Parcubacteria group bacterium GW2011_GWA2_47_26]|nr:MAG: UvrABC system protein A [Parcubacteria group bacterium GW2011_GWA2_47_26]